MIWLLAGLTGGSSISATQAFEASATPTRLPEGKLEKHHPAFALSVASLLQQSDEKQDFLLVDVRKKSDFEKLSIPGSINIPLFAVKTKTFLKSKSLVLVDEGYHYRKLERECENLRKLGFKVWHLNGGLYLWSRNGGSLKGDVFAGKDLNRIPAPTFLEEKDYAHWVVIDISPADDSDNPPLFPGAVSLPYSNGSKRFLRRFKEALATFGQNPSLTVIIVDENEEQYDRIERLLEEADYSIFFLKGGLEGYQQFSKQQTVIRQAKDNSKKSVKRCANCP